MNKDDKNRHFVLLIIDISKHGAKEMGHVKMAGPSFVNDAYSMMTRFWFFYKTGSYAVHNISDCDLRQTYIYILYTLKSWIGAYKSSNLTLIMNQHQVVDELIRVKARILIISL